MTNRDTLQKIKELLSFNFNVKPLPVKAPASVKLSSDATKDIQALNAQISSMRETMDVVVGKYNDLCKQVGQFQTQTEKALVALSVDPETVAKEKAAKDQKEFFDYHSSEAKNKRKEKYFR